MCKEPAAAMVRKAVASAVTVVVVTVMVVVTVQPVIPAAAKVPAVPKVVVLLTQAAGQVRGPWGQRLEECHRRNSGQHGASRQNHACERQCCDSVRPRSPQGRPPRSKRRPLSYRNCTRCWPLQRARRGNTGARRTVRILRLLPARWRCVSIHPFLRSRNRTAW